MLLSSSTAFCRTTVYRKCGSRNVRASLFALWPRSCLREKRRRSVKTLTLAVLGFIASWAYGANPNPRDLVKASISNYEKDWNASLDFTYTEHDISKDPSGRIKTAEISQVSVLDGTPYNRLIGKNGQPLTAEEEEKENEKYRK